MKISDFFSHVGNYVLRNTERPKPQADVGQDAGRDALQHAQKLAAWHAAAILGEYGKVLTGSQIGALQGFWLAKTGHGTLRLNPHAIALHGTALEEFHGIPLLSGGINSVSHFGGLTL